MKGAWAKFRRASRTVRATGGVICFLAGLMWPGGGAGASEPCSLAFVVSAYAAGVAQDRKGDRQGALTQWRPLAENGFPPAQRRLAAHLADKGDLAEAAFWALAASRGADLEGVRLAETLRLKMDVSTFAAAGKRVRARPVAYAGCRSGWPGKGERDGTHRLVLDGFDVVASEKLDKKVSVFVLKRVASILSHARKKLPLAALVLPELDRVEILSSDANTRYVGWRNGKKNILRLTASDFLDKKPDFLAKAIALSAARYAARRIPDLNLRDPYYRERNGKRLIGSVYPDIKNGAFFKAVDRVLAMAAKLPKDIRKYVDAVDAIHYSPHSKYFIKAGPVDAVAGFYNTRLSEDGNRMIFIRRKMMWNSDMGLLLLLVHEGTHVLQHATAAKYARSLRLTKLEMSRLPKDAPERDSLRQKMRKMRNYIETWTGTGKDERGLAKRIRFECEATINEIKAAQALNAPPELIEDSQYLQYCDEPKAMMVKWRDRRLRDGMKKMNGK